MIGSFLGGLLNKLPAQVDNYLEYCKLSNSVSNSCLDLKDLDYIYPTTLLPLLVKHPCHELEILPNNDCSRYLKHMAVSKESQKATDASYFPPLSLPKDNSDYQNAIKNLYDFHNDGKEYGGMNAFKLVVGELADNIYQHSHFDEAMIFAQKYPTKKFVELCIIDRGIGIRNALKNFGLKFTNDAEAIYFATHGLSSKKGYGRGSGIKGCISLYCRQTNGSMLIVSGDGGFFIEKSMKPNLFKFPDSYRLEGTLISFRIPYPCQEINIYEGDAIEQGVY